MRSTLKHLVQTCGWYLRKRNGLPAGVDLLMDVSRDTDPLAMTTVLDVGANVGRMSEYFAQCFPHARIIGFEPIPETFAVLRKRTGGIGRISVHPLALSDTSGTAEVFLQSDSGLNSLATSVNQPSASMNRKSVSVKKERLDDWCRKQHIDQIDLLKIDAEGHDLEVLRGAESMLAAGRVRYLLVEAAFHPDNQRNTSFSSLNEYLFEYGYKVRGIHDQSTFGNKSYLTCVNVLYLLQQPTRGGNSSRANCRESSTAAA